MAFLTGYCFVVKVVYITKTPQTILIMSKLPNAPLLEVIFELTWAVNAPKERDKFQFFMGDMYTQLKNDYPIRQSLIQMPMQGLEIPLEVFTNRPIYRFKKNGSDYPLYQLGPGLLSVNTVDSVYIWEDFEKEVLKVVGGFQKSSDFDSEPIFNIALKYIDFYPFDFTKNNPYTFLCEKLHLDIKDNTQVGVMPLFVTFSTGYITEYGLFNYVINKGGINQKGEGFLVETHLSTQVEFSHLADNVTLWLQKAHDFLSETFKTMTKGDMYNSFL